MDSSGGVTRRLRRTVLVGVLFVHALLMAFASMLPERLAEIVAGSIYLPLWPWSVLGLPVHLRAEAGGWPGPSLLGWAIVAMTWCSVWSLLIVGLLRRR